MTNWKQGSWTGSINALVRREIREHFRNNASAQKSRYPLIDRIIHRLFDGGTFKRFIVLYFVFALLVGVAELVLTLGFPSYSLWAGPSDIKPFLTSVASYMITAQVGVLGVVSIAVGLITIIAEGEGASSDVQVYYHESMAFGLVASSIALLAVLCAQLLWPLQFSLHWIGYGTGLQIFKLVSTSVHLAWLLLNLGGLAHFVATTLAFVQQRARERLRERYTTNVVLPVEMTSRLREQLFQLAGPEFVQEFWLDRPGTAEPLVYLGTDFGSTGEVEISIPVGRRLVLRDVRMAWLRWAVGRWLRRCGATSTDLEGRRNGRLGQDLILVFPPRLDDAADARTGLCRRRGGLPLSRREKLAIRFAFKFGKVRNEA